MQDELESLFVNNEKLQQIQAYINRFNPIRVMRMEGMEIRHSAILAWLMDPQETHGFGDHFLKSFLAEALRGNSGRRPSALEVAQADLRDADIRREWNNIDILVLSPRNGWAFVVENKFHSVQHGGQLKKYRDRIEELVDLSRGSPQTKLLIQGVFLTLSEEMPEDSSYVTIRYATICTFLQRFLKQESYQISAEVRIFLNHYIEILEVATGMSKELLEMQKLARQLYREHRKVLEFVQTHGAGSDFALAARNLFGENTDYLGQISIGGRDYIFNALSNSNVSFLPLNWYEALGEDTLEWPGCEDWWAGYPLIVWLDMWNNPQKNGGGLKLHVEVGPLADHEFRKGVIERIQSIAEEKKLANIRFQNGATDKAKKFSKFFRNNTANVEDVQNVEIIEDQIKVLLKKFQPEFDAVGSILSEFKRYGKADT
ncbi:MULTISPECIES: PD-(D/E)XK nuclease family protein [Mesorhizobium]|nr:MULTISPECIES: PD-(D/E)XK nuclease family protein [Mesorhizobium]